jgi:uncharacterized protein YhaN
MPDRFPAESRGDRPPENVGELGMPALPGESGFGEDRDLPPPELPASPGSPGARQEEPVPRLREQMTRREGSEERRRQIEELVEGIIEEKWLEFRNELANMQAQLAELANKLAALEGSMKNSSQTKRSDMDEIDEKIESYKQSMGEISSRMGAMENAMKSSMTPMMQTMRSLSDAVKSLKDGTTSKTKKKEE